jgi:L-alanine-DL-glutamate epimerase-like enolase superfamily enzyme
VRIIDVESFVVGNPWKAWYFALVHTDEGITGIGEGEGYLWADALRAFAEQNKELLFLGQDPFRIEAGRPPLPVARLATRKTTRRCPRSPPPEQPTILPTSYTRPGT